jgi:hypothetical protein
MFTRKVIRIKYLLKASLLDTVKKFSFINLLKFNSFMHIFKLKTKTFFKFILFSISLILFLVYLFLS